MHPLVCKNTHNGGPHTNLTCQEPLPASCRAYPTQPVKSNAVRCKASSQRCAVGDLNILMHIINVPCVKLCRFTLMKAVTVTGLTGGRSNSAFARELEISSPCCPAHDLIIFMPYCFTAFVLILGMSYFIYALCVPCVCEVGHAHLCGEEAGSPRPLPKDLVQCSAPAPQPRTLLLVTLPALAPRPGHPRRGGG